MSSTQTIAIDGFSSCGKSTLARDLAKDMRYTYIDSGAMYRAVTLYFLNNDIDFQDEDAVHTALHYINIDFDSKNKTLLNGMDVEKDIRTQEVSNHVSEVAALSSVRKKLVELQRKLSFGNDVIMDGRDIGTVVFPDAEIKFFVTADLKVRTQRRWKELKSKGVIISKSDVEQNLSKRDHIDSTRKDSPLQKAEDAILIDTTNLNRKEQLKLAKKLIRNRSHA